MKDYPDLVKQKEEPIFQAGEKAGTLSEFDKNFPAGGADNVLFVNLDTFAVMSRRELAIATESKMEKIR